MGQTALSFDQKTCFNPNTKLLLCFLTKTLLKEKRAKPGQIKFALLEEKWSKLSWKDNTGQTVLYLIQIS